MILDTFTRHYLIAALWSSLDDECHPMDRHYSIEDFHPDTLRQAIKDCQNFQGHAAVMLAFAYEHYKASGAAAHKDAGSPEACAGHDFWLTRGHHGAGFWDRGMGDLGQQLTQFVQDHYPDMDLYIDDEGKIRA